MVEKGKPGRPSSLNKKATVVLLVVSLASIIVINYSLPFFFDRGGKPVDTGRITIGNITIHLDFKNIADITRVNVTSTYANVSVFDIMNAEFSIRYDAYPVYGLYVSYINDQGPGWTYQVNGVAPGYSSTKYIVTNNSIITWNQV
ncbi:MAG: DUF4430 domain-containing protein [Candidatus Lokiarchaeota archaeon]|nr:DUF4430 domain-containing protein [Candidatus Lokiarchaeota archaeon]